MVRAGGGARGARGRGAFVVLVALVALPYATQSDMVFRVPEVLVRHAAASKPVGASGSNDSRTPSVQHREGALEVKYEEYFVEHDISTTAAKKAAFALDLDKLPVVYGCGTCTHQEMQYCESRVLADHCCCERKIFPEPFPWLPHTCYVGPHRCKPLAPNCARYTRLRDCCCSKKLAERWKAILSKSSRVGCGGASLLLLSMLLFVAYL